MTKFNITKLFKRELARKAHQRNTPKMADNYKFQNKFYQLIEFGNLPALQRFYHFNPDRIDISAENEQAFSYACEFGHLEIAEWLFLIKPDINISAENEYAFRYASKNGHLTVAEWLLQIKPDINISADNDFAFRYASANKHSELANWLRQIK